MHRITEFDDRETKWSRYEMKEIEKWDGKRKKKLNEKKNEINSSI